MLGHAGTGRDGPNGELVKLLLLIYWGKIGIGCGSRWLV